MTEKERAVTATEQESPAPADLRHPHARSSAIVDRLARPRSRDEAEERYVAARAAWTAAMRASNSGRSNDLAALAMAQEAYEEALAERNRWASSPSVAIPVRPERPRGLEAVVGQELTRRRVHEQELARERARQHPGGLRGLVRRITGR